MSEQKPDVTAKNNISRRTAFGLALGAAAAGGLAALHAPPTEVTVLTQAPTQTPIPPESSVVTIPPTEVPRAPLSEVGMLFAQGYDAKDVSEYCAQVLKEKENIQKNRYEGISVDADKKRVNAWRGQIDAAIASVHPPIAPFISKILPGIIFVESKGDPSAEKKENQALGLCQVTPIVLQELERVSPGFTKGKNLKDPGDNIAIAAKYMDHLFTLFPDPALAVWAYHIGQSRMARSIYKYLAIEKKVLTEPEYDLLAAPQTVSLVKRFRQELSVPKLMDSISLAIEIEDQYTDAGLKAGALRYVPLIAAGNELLAA